MTIYRVEVSVPFDEMEEWHKINDIGDEMGESCDAGTGFGCRDIGYLIEGKKEAIAFQKKIKKAFSKAGFNGVTSFMNREEGES